MSAAPRPAAKLRRSRHDKKIAGVCGGVAEYLAVDSTLIRLIWLMLAFFGGWGILGYIVAWIIMPQEPECATAKDPAPSGIPQPAGNH
jgi:phage shock protein C